ncbi:heme-binding protein [Pseudomonas asiatica]|uniref:GlcG/HbpS family heme-binding protein n=1 Tax=Pseudomonas asiatica TaxID=2219225 RepID=UPI00256FAA69|nr:heme-binding protein [Pseudomonas asiatica]WJD72310.1 heme-binding protein [Pseudomonas asiatica]
MARTPERWVTQRYTLTLALAMEALNAALDKAAQLHIKVSLVVVDDSGLAIHSAHMDGAPRQAQAIALSKAATAAGFGIATNEWSTRLQRCSPAVQQGLPLQSGMALFGGGEPLRHAGQVIGAIGVSGASENQDADCARAAAVHVQALLGE